MMPSARLVGVGMFVAGGLLLFALGLFFIGDRRMLFDERFEVRAQFARLAGLQTGAMVRVSGMAAGEVTRITIPDSPAGRFSVHMHVREDVHGLVRRDSVATIRTNGLVGQPFVQVEAGSAAEPAVASAGVIRSREPTDFDDLIDEARATVTNVNETVTEVRADLGHVVAAVGRTADEAHEVVESVGRDVEAIGRAGRRLSDDAARLVEGIRAGRGTIGRLIVDDELYVRATGIARETEAAVRAARETAEHARSTIANLRGAADGGSLQTILGDLGETVTSTREAMSNLAEDTEALKRSFLFRGYFEDRGYYDLDRLTEADYRAGALAGRHRVPIRIWLRADLLFAGGLTDRAATDNRGAAMRGEQLTDAGRVRLDRAMAEVLRYPGDTPLVVEAFADGVTRDARYRRARHRATQVVDYVRSRFGLSRQRLTTMALDSAAGDAPDEDGDRMAIAVWVDRRVLADPDAH
jgi:phospholipid/cholesterol/gamma-HCH transport system substrate-binding protein